MRNERGSWALKQTHMKANFFLRQRKKYKVMNGQQSYLVAQGEAKPFQLTHYTQKHMEKHPRATGVRV